jgi:hypothetical protein
VATAKRKGKKAPTEGAPDHFKKLLKGSCSNHAYPVKHMYKDCSLMKRFLSGGSNRGVQKKKPDPSADNVEEKEGAFPETTGCLMIFSEMVVYDSKCRQKLMCARSTQPSQPHLPSSDSRDPLSPLTDLTTRKASIIWADICSWSIRPSVRSGSPRC